MVSILPSIDAAAMLVAVLAANEVHPEDSIDALRALGANLLLRRHWTADMDACLILERAANRLGIDLATIRPADRLVAAGGHLGGVGLDWIVRLQSSCLEYLSSRTDMVYDAT